jgi:Uma2 family endonuclease
MIGDAGLPNPKRRDDIMAMPITIPRYTVDEIESWPDDGNRYELLDGILLVSSQAGPTHQVVATRIAAALVGFVSEWPDILVASPGAIVIRPSLDLQPDVLVFRRPPGETRWERVTEHLLAVEVESRSTKVYDRDYKRPAYLSLGVHEVWRVDPARRLFFVSQPGGATDEAHAEEVRWRSPSLGRELTLGVQSIFRDLQ